MPIISIILFRTTSGLDTSSLYVLLQASLFVLRDLQILVTCVNYMFLCMKASNVEALENEQNKSKLVRKFLKYEGSNTQYVIHAQAESFFKVAIRWLVNTDSEIRCEALLDIVKPTDKICRIQTRSNLWNEFLGFRELYIQICILLRGAIPIKMSQK